MQPHIKFIVGIILCGSFSNCTEVSDNPKNQVLTVPELRSAPTKNSAAQIPYNLFLQQIKKEKAAIKNIDSARMKLYNCMSQQMPAYWMGTGWDFNGTTRLPKHGNIACGYFVTTILQDMGFAINRTKLAQQVSSVMIRLLTKNIASFANITDVEKYVARQPNYSVFIIGLDFHTGFVIKDTYHGYFFHSNYINRQGVVWEKLENSMALKSSKSFMIGSLSANGWLLQQWLAN